MSIYEYIVVGAGISGLSAAYTLHQHQAKVLVVEARPTVGGALCSEQTSDGFVLEHGTQTVSSSGSELWQHFDDLGIAQEYVISTSQRTYVPRNGVLHPIPLSPMDFLHSRLLSASGKMRMLFEPLLPRAATSDESVAAFFSRRLGAEVTRRLVDPFVAGVYGGNPSELSMRALFPSLWEMEQRHGSLVRGLLASSKTNHKDGCGGSYGRRDTFSFQRGLATWPKALAQALGPDRVWLNTSAVEIAPDRQIWQVTVRSNGHEQVLQTERIILAVPSDVVAALVKDLEPAAAEALQTIAYPPLAVIHLGYRREDIAHPLDGLGILCPTHETCQAMGTLWMSTIFPSHAPDGKVLITAFVGGACNADLALHDEAHLVDLICHEQQVLIGARGEPVLVRVERWPRSIPQYDAGYIRRMGACNRLEARWPGLYLLSNYRKGFSVEDCWKKARKLSESLVLDRKVRMEIYETVTDGEYQPA